MDRNEDEESEDEDEDEDRKVLVVVLHPCLSMDDASGRFLDDTFLLVAVVLPDSTTITLAFAST